MDYSAPAPHRPAMLETITVAGDDPSSSSCSEDTDVDMHDADCIEHSGDEMMCDSPIRPSIEIDDSPSLRGGVLFRPPHLAWVKKAALAPSEERKSKKQKVQPDPKSLEGAPDDDADSVNSNWDSYGDLPLTLDEYETALARLDEEWNANQKKLHKLIYMRGLHPLMPSWWRMNFKMWGVTQPHLDDVFTPKYSKKRVAIHAYGHELAAAKALESLFYLSQTVTDYEEIGYQDKIAPTIVRSIRNYIKWALRDAGINKRRTQPTMLVRAYPPDFRDDVDSEGSDFAPSPVSSNGDHDPDGDNADDEAQRAAHRFTLAISRDLERRLISMGAQWRQLLEVDRGKKGKGFIAPPPTLYAFAVVQHIVLLASHDSSSATNPVVAVERVKLNERGQWLWNALTLALPVNMARDALNAMWETGIVVAEDKGGEGDPDL